MAHSASSFFTTRSAEERRGSPSVSEVHLEIKNYALKSMDEVRTKLRQAILYIERNPKLVRSITSFPYIVNSL